MKQTHAFQSKTLDLVTLKQTAQIGLDRWSSTGPGRGELSQAEMLFLLYFFSSTNGIDFAKKKKKKSTVLQ